MPKEHTFDIVSKANMQEVDNAINMSMKEISQRFDFKGSVSNIKKEEANKIIIVSDDEFKLKSVIDILKGKLVKRGVSLKFLEYGKIEPSLSGTVKQIITIKQGINQDKAKEINKIIKSSSLKVRSQIQGDELRVFAKKIDELQAVIQTLKKQDLGIELQFVNYR